MWKNSDNVDKFSLSERQVCKAILINSRNEQESKNSENGTKIIFLLINQT